MPAQKKNILWWMILIVLFLPMLQDRLSFIHSGPLYGEFKVAPDTKFTIEKWVDGSYQDEKDKFLNDNVSFRADMIRLNSQVDYSLFGVFNTGWGVMGKNQCLFDELYINAWLGHDFMGEDVIRKQLLKLKAVQDTLARLNKPLIVIYAVSKPYFYTDCIPDRYLSQKRGPTNYSVFLRIGDSLGINQMDLNAWLCSMRYTSKPVLYPKQGIHWSMYAGNLVADTLAKYVDRLKHIAMPLPVLRDTTYTSDPRFTDNDIAKVMNLIWPITKEKFAYGNVVFDTSAGKTKQRAIYIGDSFTWPLIDNYDFDCFNSEWEFWFYFKQRYAGGDNARRRQFETMENYNWQQAVDSADYITLIYTPHNLTQFGNGFIEKAYAYYFPDRK